MTTILANDSRIIYSGQWKHAYWSPGSRWTTQSWSTATYHFNGTGKIQVFGTQFPDQSSPEGPRVDFKVNSRHFPGLNAVPFSNTSLFSTSLNDSESTLVITLESKYGGIALYSIVVENFSDSPVAGQTASTSNSDLNSTTASSTHAPSSDFSASSRAGNVGGIVGGVIAGLVALASLIAFVLYRRRKRIQAARRTSPYAVTPFITEYSKSSSPEPIKNMQSVDIAPVPILSFSSEMGHQDEPPPAFIPGLSNAGRHESMYKPRQSVESLPPTEFGYGGGLSREEWSRYTSKSKS